MQTDPTGVLVGYALVSTAILRWKHLPRRSDRVLLIVGLSVLWLTRIESGMMATTAIALLLALHPGRRSLLKDLLIGTEHIPIER